MPRQKNDQIPLGELLTKARLDKHMSRAQLAKETGIRENSLMRYEKAGLEKDGQYPPSPKLAKLCFALDISPLTAMFSCLEREEFWGVKNHTFENWLMDHPDVEFVLDEAATLAKENRKLAATLRLFLGPDPKAGSYEEEMLNWLKGEARRIIEIQEAFDKRLADNGCASQLGLVVIPGDPHHKSRNNGEPSISDYAAFAKEWPGSK
jgi:transcriptional regulator with XRE-family HTH domain